MQLRAEYLMKALSHCLSEIVAPAIEKSNGVAQEQVAIAIGLLDFMAERQPQQYAFDCNELENLLELAKSLHRLGCSDEHIVPAIENADVVLASARAGPLQVARQAKNLRELIRVAVETLHAEGGETRKALQAKVLAQAKAALTVERAWLTPLGFERGAQPLPPLEELLPLDR